jgi:hypothetical protein
MHTRLCVPLLSVGPTGSLFCPEHAGGMFLQNIGTHLLCFTASLPNDDILH